MKYLFIDTNIYKYLFNENTTFSGDVVDLIKKLIDNEKLALIMPTQVIDEVKRNHLENWYVTECDDKEKNKDTYIKNLDSKIESLKEFPKLRKTLEIEKKKFLKNYEKELKSVEERYRNPKKSKSVGYFETLKKMAQVIDSDTVIEKAITRSHKNNPPYDKKKNTDAIIWESVLHFFREKNKKSILYFLSDDGCYGSKGFNPFLSNELKQYKVTVHYRKSISSLKDLLGNDIGKIIEQEKEEQKKKAIANFIGSRSWMSAGSNFNELVKFKTDLTLDDYKNIIKAATINDQIYGSFFVNMPDILEDDTNKGFVLSILEEIEDSHWESFKKRNQVFLKRKKDNQSELSQVEF
jgi:predicted nucleic acid-binding protein